MEGWADEQMNKMGEATSLTKHERWTDGGNGSTSVRYWVLLSCTWLSSLHCHQQSWGASGLGMRIFVSRRRFGSLDLFSSCSMNSPGQGFLGRTFTSCNGEHLVSVDYAVTRLRGKVGASLQGRVATSMSHSLPVLLHQGVSTTPLTFVPRSLLTDCQAAQLLTVSLRL